MVFFLGDNGSDAPLGSQHVHPLHLQFGFNIELAERMEETNEFVWIVSYDGTKAEWEQRQKEYYGSPERAAVDPDPARFIAKAQRWFIEDRLPAR